MGVAHCLLLPSTAPFLPPPHCAPLLLLACRLCTLPALPPAAAAIVTTPPLALDREQNGKSVQVPIYDFATHRRSPETRKVDPADVVIMEGIMVLHMEGGWEAGRLGTWEGGNLGGRTTGRADSWELQVCVSFCSSS